MKHKFVKNGDGFWSYWRTFEDRSTYVGWIAPHYNGRGYLTRAWGGCLCGHSTLADAKRFLKATS